MKAAVKFINKFEQTAADIAISNEYQYVICGHIHHPEIREIKTEQGSVTYMNSGDWVENLTALEFDGYEWSIYHYNTDKVARSIKLPTRFKEDRNNQEIFRDLVNEFNNLKK